MIPVEVYYVLPYVLAFLLAVAIPIGATLQYRLARSVSSDARVIVLLVVIAAGALLTVALTPRNLDERDIATAGRLFLTDFEDGFAASRYLNMFLVGTGFVEMVRGWINSRATVVADPARPILIGLVAFYIGTIVIQALGSAHPDFSYKALYVPIILLAVFYQRVNNIALVIQVAKLAVLALMVASLVGIIIKPDFVLHRPERGLIPGVDFRLFGLTPHANALGPIALIGLILELHSPSVLRSMRTVHLLATSAVFILAQSKTAWVACAMVVILVAVPLGFTPNHEPSKRATQFSRAVFTLLMCIGLIIAVSVALAAVDVFGYIERTAQVDTLTGRAQIWDITLQAWRENLLFGYGREIWGTERMLKLRLFHVGQAHNQFVQTLGEAGLVGLFLMIAFLLILVHSSLSRFVPSRGITFALLVVVLARSVTEAPLRLDGVLSWPTFTLILLILLAVHYMRAEPTARKAYGSISPAQDQSSGRPNVSRSDALKQRDWRSV